MNTLLVGMDTSHTVSHGRFQSCCFPLGSERWGGLQEEKQKQVAKPSSLSFDLSLAHLPYPSRLPGIAPHQPTGEKGPLQRLPSKRNTNDCLSGGETLK